MAFHIETRTVHIWHIDVPDDALAKMEAGDSVEVILQTRTGQVRKTITAGEVLHRLQ